jgi:hypothetical protein
MNRVPASLADPSRLITGRDLKLRAGWPVDSRGTIAPLEEDHAGCRVYEREMRECLPCLPVFFGLEAKRKGDPQQRSIRSRARCISPTIANADAIDRECSFVARESVICLVGMVAKDKAVLHPLFGDGESGVPQVLVILREEIEAPCQQDRGV